MKDITQNFGTLYHPKSALVFYQNENRKSDTYVEYFDIDKTGSPINAHPLTVKEAGVLSKALKSTKVSKESYLKSEGVLGNHILQVDTDKGKAIWFTKAMQREMYFSENLGISKGSSHVPAMLWAATRNNLSVFALLGNRRPTERTRLYNAPFFNVYEDGTVCMGTVDVMIKRTASLDDFTTTWENYFFNSYFSHLMESYNPVTGNCVSLWTTLIASGKPFPKEVLKKSSKTLKNFL